MKAMIAAVLAAAFALPALAQTSTQLNSPAPASVERRGPTAGEAARNTAADAKSATKRGAHKVKRKAHHAKARTKAAAHRAKVRAES
jgi:uncharacterized protein YdeI (BOF family)